MNFPYRDTRFGAGQWRGKREERLETIGCSLLYANNVDETKRIRNTTTATIAKTYPTILLDSLRWQIATNTMNDSSNLFFNRFFTWARMGSL